MSDDNYSIKEIVQEVRDKQELQGHSLTRVATTLESIELQLKKMAEGYGDHEKRIVEQEGFRGKVVMAWGVIVFVMTTVANKVLANINF